MDDVDVSGLSQSGDIVILAKSSSTDEPARSDVEEHSSSLVGGGVGGRNGSSWNGRVEICKEKLVTSRMNSDMSLKSSDSRLEHDMREIPDERDIVQSKQLVN